MSQGRGEICYFFYECVFMRRLAVGCGHRWAGRGGGAIVISHHCRWSHNCAYNQPHSND